MNFVGLTLVLHLCFRLDQSQNTGPVSLVLPGKNMKREKGFRKNTARSLYEGLLRMPVLQAISTGCASGRLTNVFTQNGS